eukprot:3554433-Amphidinium_carterae.1
MVAQAERKNITCPICSCSEFSSYLGCCAIVMVLTFGVYESQTKGGEDHKQNELYASTHLLSSLVNSMRSTVGVEKWAFKSPKFSASEFDTLGWHRLAIAWSSKGLYYSGIQTNIRQTEMWQRRRSGRCFAYQWKPIWCD